MNTSLPWPDGAEVLPIAPLRPVLDRLASLVTVHEQDVAMVPGLAVTEEEVAADPPPALEQLVDELGGITLRDLPVLTLLVENRTDAPIPEIHLRWIEDLEVRKLEVEGARVAREWPEFDYRIYRFDRPLAPGERRTIRFETVRAQKGFRNGGNITEIVDNGTFINNAGFAPMVGMSRDGLLSDRTKRRKYGLPPELRMRKLEDPAGLLQNYIGADWVNADITVTTDADQTPIAPGYKVSDTSRDGRRTARFVTEAPILHFFSVQSARYAVKREVHNGVALEIYHHPPHGRNAQRMIDALKTGLDYYQSAFGPYQFRQARIIEFPAYASFAQAFANTMPYSESIGFVADLRNPEKIDYVTFITAHELGHQWWAHQIVGADVQGATTLSETLAEYSALMVMEKMYGPDKIRRFLKYDLDNYLRSRGGERLGEALDLPPIRAHVYHVDEVNGLAAPDGRIFLTRGFITKLDAGEVTPEELASVVAHELGHGFTDREKLSHIP